MKIGLLTTPNNPFINFRSLILSKFFKTSDLFIIYDKCFNEENFKKIWDDRFNLEQFEVFFNIKKLNTIYLENHNDINLLSYVKDNNIDYLINAGTPRKISSKIISNNLCKIINIHPGIFPSYRGANCIEWAILNNDLIGATAHFMNEKYDDGLILKRIVYRFNNIYDYKQLRTSALKQDIDLSLNVLTNIKNYSKNKKINFQKRNSNFYGIIPQKKLLYIKNILVKKGISQ